MILPKLFKSENYELLREIVKENAFSNLISYTDRVRSTQAMMMLNETDAENFYIETHVHRANPVAKGIKDGDFLLCDFLGAHTYISSSWYDHTNVSTWNYEAVQIYGKVALMTDDELYNHLKKLTDTFESSQKCPVTVEKMGREFVEKEMKGALGIKIIPMEVSIKQKLSQNRDDANYDLIIYNLEKSNDAMDKKIGAKMKALR